MALSVTGERVSANWEKCLIPLPFPSSSSFTLTPSKKPGKDSKEILLRVTLMLGVVGGVLRTADGGAEACKPPLKQTGEPVVDPVPRPCISTTVFSKVILLTFGARLYFGFCLCYGCMWRMGAGKEMPSCTCTLFSTICSWPSRCQEHPSCCDSQLYLQTLTNVQQGSISLLYHKLSAVNFSSSELKKQEKVFKIIYYFKITKDNSLITDHWREQCMSSEWLFVFKPGFLNSHILYLFQVIWRMRKNLVVLTFSPDSLSSRYKQ